MTYEELRGHESAARAKAQELLNEAVAKKDADGRLGFEEGKQEQFEACLKEASHFMGLAESEQRNLQLEAGKAEMEAQQERTRRSVNALPSETAKNGREEVVGKSMREVMQESARFKSEVGDEENNQIEHMSRGQEKIIHLRGDGKHAIDIAGWVRGYSAAEQRKMLTGKAISTSTFAPMYGPQPGFTPLPLEQPTLLDYMTTSTSDLQLFSFLRQTVNTNSAGVVTEGGTKVESDVQAAYVSKQFSVVATFMTLTEQDFRFIPNIQSIIEERGSLDVKQIVQNGVINGTSTGSGDTAMAGILYDPSILTATSQMSNGLGLVMGAKLAKAKVDNYNFAQADTANANVFVCNPSDLYFAETVLNKFNEPIWPSRQMLEAYIGMRIVSTKWMGQGTNIAGDFGKDCIELAYSGQQGVIILIGYLANDFRDNKRTVRFEVFVVNAIKKPWAFCKLTNGLPAIS